ncbi:hypothetical protein PFLU4_57420 [Pseudomonas fluorescens]|nr:hypothetical protein PFLU4_57420 [Pseudomonas fluorescens]
MVPVADGPPQLGLPHPQCLAPQGTAGRSGPGAQLQRPGRAPRELAHHLHRERRADRAGHSPANAPAHRGRGVARQFAAQPGRQHQGVRRARERAPIRPAPRAVAAGFAVEHRRGRPRAGADPAPHHFRWLVDAGAGGRTGAPLRRRHRRPVPGLAGTDRAVRRLCDLAAPLARSR